MLRNKCCLCGSLLRDFFAVLDHRSLFRCCSCSCVYAGEYNEDAVQSAYKNDYYPSSDDPKIEEWNRTNTAVWEGLCDSLDNYSKKPETLLDIGAGTGGFVLAYNKRHPDVAISIVESSSEALAYVKRQLPQVTVVADDAMNVGSIKEDFDVITLFQTLEHVSDPEGFCAAIYERMKPGSIFLLTVPNRFSYKVFFQGRKEQFCYGNTTHLQFFSRCSLLRLLKKTGFSKVIRLSEVGGSSVTGLSRGVQWLMRKCAFSTELRFVAVK